MSDLRAKHVLPTPSGNSVFLITDTSSSQDVPGHMAPEATSLASQPGSADCACSGSRQGPAARIVQYTGQRTFSGVEHASSRPEQTTSCMLTLLWWEVYKVVIFILLCRQ